MTDRNRTARAAVLVLTALILGGILTGCALKKPVWGDTSTGLVLTYRMAEDQELKYAISVDHTQNMDVMGTPVQVETAKKTGFTVKKQGMDGENHRLSVTIDQASLDVQSPQGNLAPDMSSVIGKSFDMLLSTLGEELDLSGAESIEYQMGPSGTRNMAADFQTFFPDLADRPVRVGDSWNSREVITEKSGEGEVRINIQSVNTLDGFETVDGMECARISSTHQGTIEGTGTEGGMELSITGTLTGSDTWYFAYEEGWYVKVSGVVRTEGSIDATGPQSLSIPMKQEIRIESGLVP